MTSTSIANRALGPTPGDSTGTRTEAHTPPRASDRDPAERAHRRNQVQLAEAQALAHMGSWEWDMAADTIVWSDEHFRIFGLEPAPGPVGARMVLSSAHPDDRPRIDEAIQRAISLGEPFELELRILRPDGTTRFCLSRGRAETDASGKVVRLYGTCQDITEEHDRETHRREILAELGKSQQQLRQSQKLEAIGRLAGGVAHDFNNLMTVAQGYTDLALSMLGPDDPARPHLEEVQKAVDRATQLTKQLLAFSRKQVLQPRVVDLNSLVSSSQLMLSRIIGEDIEFELRLDPALGRVEVDPTQFEQVLMNLVVNSKDAMSQGGALVIATANCQVGASSLHDAFIVPPGSYVCVTVTDNGCGMDAATQARAFEPFFTTKEQGKGTGLGLATVYGIVKQSGGCITTRSAPGTGTTFTIYFPSVAAGPKANAALPPVPDPIPSPGTETILLVEDEASIRSLMQEILIAAGYRVLAAASGQEAVLLCEQNATRLDLLITDVVMPRMNGTALAERVRTISPRLKVLFMSGYSEEAVQGYGVLDRAANFLAKPFSPQALAKRVRQVLDSGVSAEPTIIG